MKQEPPLTKQQQKSYETKERIFKAAKKFYRKAVMRIFPLKISVKKPESLMEVFIIISKPKTTFYLII